MQSVYISGPMRGHKYYNFPNFDRVAKRFGDLGFQVVSPADMDRHHGFDPRDLPDDHDWHSIDGVNLREVFTRDCQMICQCTDIAMLDGWEKSKGARAEHALAVALGLKVLDERGSILSLDDRPEIVGLKMGEALGRFADPKCCDAENPKDAIGSAKPQLHLIPPVANIAEARVMQLGARKYGPYNWRETAVRASVYLSALGRHVAQWQDGENVDAESGQSHLAHAKANLSILLDAETSGKLIDDRPPAGGASEAIAAACR